MPGRRRRDRSWSSRPGAPTDADRAVIRLLPKGARGARRAQQGSIGSSASRRAAAADGRAGRALPFAAIVPVSAEKARVFDALLAGSPGIAAGWRRDLRRGRDHGSRRALPRGRVRAREDLSAAGRGGAVCDHGRRSNGYEHEGELAADPTPRSTSTAKISERSCSARAGAKMKEIAFSRPRRHGAAVRRARSTSRSCVRVARGWADDDAQLKRFGYWEAADDIMATRTQPLRRDDQPAFVLHNVCVSRDERDRRGLHRRITAGSRWWRASARRPRSELRGALAGLPAAARCRGRVNRSSRRCFMRNGGAGRARIGGLALVCGFYLNELLLKLLPREDPHPRLFARLRVGAGRPRRGRLKRRRYCGASRFCCWPSSATHCRSCAKRTPAA